jgi:hypothetical protein
MKARATTGEFDRGKGTCAACRKLEVVTRQAA